jgi:hypothetical protein
LRRELLVADRLRGVVAVREIARLTGSYCYFSLVFYKD